jgi:hypothetical protein
LPAWDCGSWTRSECTIRSFSAIFFSEGLILVASHVAKLFLLGVVSISSIVRFFGQLRDRKVLGLSSKDYAILSKAGSAERLLSQSVRGKRWALILCILGSASVGLCFWRNPDADIVLIVAVNGLIFSVPAIGLALNALTKQSIARKILETA